MISRPATGEPEGGQKREIGETALVWLSTSKEDCQKISAVSLLEHL
jgi:hypothetical protein